MTSETSDEDDWPDEEERQFKARRLFTYSVEALRVGTAVDRVMVNHPSFKSVLAGCDRVFQLSRELSMQQGVAVSGVSGTGKTALIKHYRQSLPKSDLFEVGQGALALRLVKRPTVGHLIGGLLKQLRYPFPHVNAKTLGMKHDVVVDALRQNGTRILFLDEAQHLLTQTRMRGQLDDGSNVTDCLNALMDEVPVGLALFGSEELHKIEDVDRHLASRISAHLALQPFQAGAVWSSFVKAFVRQCQQFDLAFLLSSPEQARLQKVTGGNLRDFKRLVTEAVLICVDEGVIHMGVEHFRVAFDRVYGTHTSTSNPYAI
ncbi:MAG: TniB family NTP-binding protein [Bacteroidia bacterium]|jgi:hypothetical protein